MNKPFILGLGVLVLFVFTILGILYFGFSDETQKFDSQYNCEQDVYNCDNFSTQTEAQEVFEYCYGKDIHQLDQDNDGLACESLLE